MEAAMQSKLLHFTKGWRLALKNDRAQAAEMVIPAGDAEGGPRNEHQGADQWLFVIDGVGTATIEGRRRTLKAGMLLLIERKNRHEIRNTGAKLLRTLNIYVPPAYKARGAPLPAGRTRRRVTRKNRKASKRS
jgi:mannose-6-phosphate isomerase-like protein (cupin superfamily)